jgi:hypothetical protein
MSLKLQADLAGLADLAVDLARRITELERRPLCRCPYCMPDPRHVAARKAQSAHKERA